MAKKKGNNYIIDTENNIAKIELNRTKFVDHEDHNTLDDRKCNLRVVEDARNAQNRKSKNKNNKSGYRNVSWDGYKWVVQLQVDGKNTCLGRFAYDELEQAGKFAEEMRQKYYGEFAGVS